MIKANLSQKGFGVLSLILLLALAFAIVNAYAYFNPTFSLSRYSPLNYFRIQQDDKRVEDLKALEASVLKFYEQNSEMPAIEDWCGRISGVLHPEFRDDVGFDFPNGQPPQDPLRGGSDKDYFYYRVDRSHYILMAVLEVPREQGLDKAAYNFTGCHDWPGNDIYNYQLNNTGS